MRKVFLGVPSGEDGHVEDSPIGKLDLQDFLHLLGAHKIRRWDIRDGWPTAQLPFLTLRILQSFGSLEGGVHPGVLPECGTKPGRLFWWLEKKLCIKQNFRSSKLLRVLIPHVLPIGWPGTEFFLTLAKRTAQQKQGFEFKVSQAFC
jgi:hypothetical protein